LRDPAPTPAGGTSRRQYCFGEFTLDLDAGLLRRGTQEVTLRSKPFEVLAYLVQHHGRLVTKSALFESVWSDTTVTDNSLAQCLLEIRRALGDDSQQLIRTMKRRGYIFAASVTISAMDSRRQLAGVETHAAHLTEHSVSPAWRSHGRMVIVGAFLAVALGALVMLWPTPPARDGPAYEQTTNFPDAAVSPALSPDGRMLAFIKQSVLSNCA
jgi:DNA-binding winged helix-turn-helix (wHTH) protein